MPCWEDESFLDDEEREALPEQMATADGYAAHYGLPPLRTVNDVLNLLVAARVVHEIPDAAGVLRLHPAQPLPRPADVLPLDDAERAAQSYVRHLATHRGASEQLIDLFDPEGERIQEITTSLERLARVIQGSPDDARQAVQLLLDEGDFTARHDITGLATHRVFQLRCDWDKFDSLRITLRGLDEEGRIVATLPNNLAPADSVEGPLSPA